MTANSNFYGADAAVIYSANFDYTVIESDKAQPNVSPKILSAAIRRTLSTAVAAIAFSGILTFPSGGLFPYGVSVTSSLTQQASRSPGLFEMTALMRQRAAIAARIFHSAPHPGNDDVEPDYGF